MTHQSLHCCSADRIRFVKDGLGEEGQAIGVAKASIHDVIVPSSVSEHARCRINPAPSRGGNLRED